MKYSLKPQKRLQATKKTWRKSYYNGLIIMRWAWLTDTQAWTKPYRVLSTKRKNVEYRKLHRAIGG